MAADSKLLAEWFWVDRWMGSSAFLLPIGARGLYREMLSQAWRRGARLPNDHESIRRAVGVTAKEWSRNWPLIERFWHIDGKWLVNPTQQEVYADAKARQEGASTRASAAAQARWAKGETRRGRSSGNARAYAQASPTAPLEQSPPSPSPSPSPITNCVTEALAVHDPEAPQLDMLLDAFLREVYPKAGFSMSWETQQAWVAAFADCPDARTVTARYDELVAAVRQHARSMQWRDGKIPLVSKWLKEQRWHQVLPEGRADARTQQLIESSQEFLK